MHYVVTALGTAGDVLPFIGIAKQLQSRGHKVTLLTGEAFLLTAQQQGIEAVSILTQAEFDATLRDPTLWQAGRGFVTAVRGFALPAMERAYRYIEQHRQSDTILLGSTLAFGARCAAEQWNIPYLSTHLAPAIFRSTIKPPYFPGLWMPSWMPQYWKDFSWFMIDKLYYDPLLLGPINAFRKNIHLPLIKRLLQDWMHNKGATLGLFPDWFAAPQEDWVPGAALSNFPLFDGTQDAPISTDLADWVARWGAPIIFTLGSGKVGSEEFFRQAAAACENLNHPGILLTPNNLPFADSLPAFVRVEKYLPFSSFLPQAAAIVHHGGIGTTSQALRAGIPQLVLPMAHDQHDNARHIVKLGVGKELRVPACHANKLADTLYDLMHHSMVQSRCDVIKDKFKDVDTLALITDSVEAWAF